MSVFLMMMDATFSCGCSSSSANQLPFIFFVYEMSNIAKIVLVLEGGGKGEGEGEGGSVDIPVYSECTDKAQYFVCVLETSEKTKHKSTCSCS